MIRTKKTYHKSTFDKISEERRQKILDVAISEFSTNGFNATNINVISKKAEISIGSMYSYFDSKEALFLTVVDRGYHLLERALDEIRAQDGDFFETVEKLLRASRYYAINYPELNQIYLDATTQGLANLSSKLSMQMESLTADMYLDVIRKAKTDGTIRPDVDEHLLSFTLDNLILMFQFSYTSDYYKERMKIFLGPDAIQDEERIVQGIMTLIKKGLQV